MTINGVKFHKRDLLAGALAAIWVLGFLWLALAIVDPLEQMIIEAKK